MSILRASYKNGYAHSAAESMYPQLWPGLAGAWFPLLGPTGLVLRDVSGNGIHGTLNAMELDADWIKSDLGWALNFDGIAGGGEYVSIPVVPGVSTAADQQWTMAGWVRWDGRAPSAALSLGDSGSYPTGAILPHRGAGTVQCYLPNAYRDSGVAPPLNTWFHVALSRASATKGTLYVHGVPYSANPTQTNAQSQVFQVGKFSGLGLFYEGQIAAAGVWNRVLTDSEVMLLATSRPDALVARPDNWFSRNAVPSVGAPTGNRRRRFFMGAA